MGKAANTVSGLSKRECGQTKNLTVHATFIVYRACGLSVLLYGSESWTLRASHERKLNIFTMQYLRRLLNIVFSLCKH